jgi:hypothetical protein
MSRLFGWKVSIKGAMRQTGVLHYRHRDLLEATQPEQARRGGQTLCPILCDLLSAHFHVRVSEPLDFIHYHYHDYIMMPNH